MKIDFIHLNLILFFIFEIAEGNKDTFLWTKRSNLFDLSVKKINLTCEVSNPIGKSSFTYEITLLRKFSFYPDHSNKNSRSTKTQLNTFRRAANQIRQANLRRRRAQPTPNQLHSRLISISIPNRMAPLQPKHHPHSNIPNTQNLRANHSLSFIGV